MKIGIQAWGTDGDIEPLLAIAVELSKREHQVCIDILRLKKRDYSFLEAYKNLAVNVLDFPEEEFAAATRDISKQFWDTSNPDALQFVYKRHEVIAAQLEASAERLSAIADVVLGTQHTLELCCYADKYKKPFFSLSYEHSLIRSKEFPPLGYECNEEEWIIFMWDKVAESVHELHHKGINEYRHKLGLPPVTDVLDEITHSKLLNLVSYSASLYPRQPADWGGRHYTCGYINSESIYADWNPSHSLQQFANEGEKPIFVSFSNMILTEDNLEAFQNMVIAAIKKSGQRAIFLSDWSGNAEPVSGIYKLSGFVYLPKVFELCSLLIHPGGTGFTHDAAKSGLPCIVVPYGFDQFYNADVLCWHGLSRFKIPRLALTEDRLVEAITQSLRDESMKAKAAEFRKAIVQDRGETLAADLIEEKFSQLSAGVPKKSHSFNPELALSE